MAEHPTLEYSRGTWVRKYCGNINIPVMGGDPHNHPRSNTVVARTNYIQY